LASTGLVQAEFVAIRMFPAELPEMFRVFGLQLNMHSSNRGLLWSACGFFVFSGVPPKVPNV